MARELPPGEMRGKGEDLAQELPVWEFDLARWFRGIWRRKWWWIVPALLGGAIGWLVSARPQVQYRVTASLLPQSPAEAGQRGASISASPLLTLALGGGTSSVYAEMIESWPFKRAAAALLAKYPQFFRDCTLGKRVLIDLRDIPPEIRHSFRMGGAGQEIPDELWRQMAAVKAQAATGSSIVKVEMVSPDVQQACDVLNAVCAAFVLSAARDLQQGAEVVQGYLDRQIEDCRRRLDVLRRQAADLARKVGTGIGAEGAGSFYERAWKAAEKLAEAETELRAAEARLRYLNERLAREQPVEVVEEVSENPAVAQLRQQIAELEVKRAELLTEYTESSPKVKAVDAQLEVLRRELNRAVGEKVKTRSEQPNPVYTALMQEKLQWEARATALRAQIPKLRAEYARLMGRLQRLPDEVMELKRVQLELQLEEQRYQALRAEQEQYRTVVEGRASPAKVISPAVAAGWKRWPAVVPPRKMMMATGIFAGLVMGLLLALAVEWTEDRFVDEVEVSARLGMPLLGALPEVSRGEVLLAGEREVDSEYLHSLWALRRALRLGDVRGRILAVAGAGRGHGCSTLAANLAISHARAGYSAAVVDSDPWERGLSRIFGLEGETGLMDVLAEQVDGEQAVKLPLEGLPVAVVPAGRAGTEAEWLAWLERKALAELLRSLAQRFDLVIVDLPPMTELGAAAVVGGRVHEVVVVICPRRARRREVAAGIERLRQAGAKLAGMVASRV